MGLLSKLAGAKRTEESPAKAKKQTAWIVGASKEEAAIGEAITQFVDISRKMKDLEGQAGPLKAMIKEHAQDRFVEDFAARGVMPDTPMYVQNRQGQKVTFVVQDRSSQYPVKQAAQDDLADLLGQDAAADLLYEETTFSFNRALLANPAVFAVVEKHLEKLMAQLVKDKLLEPEQAESLLDVEQKVAFKPGTLDRLPEICGRDVTRMERMLEIMGGCATRYVKS